jgi:hypothetical protein
MKETYKNKPENITFFENLYDENWFKSTKEMLKKANYDYIYLYWEDHFLVNTVEYFKDVINDMGES